MLNWIDNLGQKELSEFQLKIKNYIILNILMNKLIIEMIILKDMEKI